MNQYNVKHCNIVAIWLRWHLKTHWWSLAGPTELAVGALWDGPDELVSHQWQLLVGSLQTGACHQQAWSGKAGLRDGPGAEASVGCERGQLGPLHTYLVQPGEWWECSNSHSWGTLGQLAGQAKNEMDYFTQKVFQEGFQKPRI